VTEGIKRGVGFPGSDVESACVSRRVDAVSFVPHQLLHQIPHYLLHTSTPNSCSSQQLISHTKYPTSSQSTIPTMVDRSNKPSALHPSGTGPSPTVYSDGKKVTATLPTGDSVEVMLYGATVTSWKSNGKEHMWLSEKAILDGSKAIRGGIPVVFPVSPTCLHVLGDLATCGCLSWPRWQQSKSMGISRHDKMRVRQSESVIAAASSAGLPAYQSIATPVAETRWKQRLIRYFSGFRPTTKEPRNFLPPSARLRPHLALGVPWQVLF